MDFFNNLLDKLREQLVSGSAAAGVEIGNSVSDAGGIHIQRPFHPPNNSGCGRGIKQVDGDYALMTSVSALYRGKLTLENSSLLFANQLKLE